MAEPVLELDDRLGAAERGIEVEPGRVVALAELLDAADRVRPEAVDLPTPAP
jgi:hypothetical protein